MEHYIHPCSHIDAKSALGQGTGDTGRRVRENTFLSTDLPIGLIKKKKEPQLYNFSSVALQLLVTSDDYKETYTYNL